jgi:site-specific DNA recombinase
VQDQLAAKARRHRSQVGAVEPSLLAGMLTDGHGNRFTPSHAVKNGRRYRYYVSAAPITKTGKDRAQVRRLAAHEIEGAVIRILVEALTSPARLLERFGTGDMPADQMHKILGRAARLAAAFSGSPRDRAKLVQGLVEKVIVDDKTIIIKRRRGALLGRDIPSSASEDPSSLIELTAAVAFKRRGVETKLYAARTGSTEPQRATRSGADQGDRARLRVV